MNFVSETTLQENRAKRAAEWADTYERINVKPPVLEEQPYDPRSLAEQLAANKAVKEAEFEERIKFSLSLPCPALRPLIFGGRKPVPVSEDARACGTVQPARSGIDDEEAGFLSDMAYDIRQQERMQKEEIANELASFRECAFLFVYCCALTAKKETSSASRPAARPFDFHFDPSSKSRTFQASYCSQASGSR
jgi:hypothetical protein